MKSAHSRTRGRGPIRGGAAGRWVLRLLLLTLPWVFVAGCPWTRKPSGPPPQEKLNKDTADELLSYAMQNLDRLEDFNSNDMLQRIQKRLMKSADLEPSDDTLMVPWPEPEMLQQIVLRLNQWIESQKPLPDWKRDPLVATLPDRLKELPLVEGLDKLRFPRYDGLALRETVWLRDVSNWARGDEQDDLSRAKRLFDWTVRNIQLKSPHRDAQGGTVPLVPWENLLFGYGTPVERAWVFVLLARQQGLDAALIGLAEPPPETATDQQASSDDASDKKDAKTAAKKTPKPGAVAKQLRLWTVGVLIEGKVYLFEPSLGLPIPAPDGIRVDEKTGELDIQPATLAQVVEDDALLRQLDTRSGPYGLESSDIKHAVALIEASPIYVAQRMRILESRVAGEQKIILSIDATEQAKRFAECPSIAESRLWTYPYQVLNRRSHLSRSSVQRVLADLLPFYEMPNAPLGKGRMLYLEGQFKGKAGAIAMLQDSRMSSQGLEQAAKIMEEQFVKNHERWMEKQGDGRKLTKKQRAEVEARGRDEVKVRIKLFEQARRAANYWLGVLVFENGEYESAIKYFEKQIIDPSLAGPWTEGAIYNLGRSYEALKEPGKAIVEYKKAFKYKKLHVGCLVRANWLEKMYPKADEPTVPEPDIPEPDIPEPDIPEPETAEPVVPDSKAEKPKADEAQSK